MAKKLKDPNKPKKPLTAYFRFLKDHRARVKAENPDLKPPHLTKKCGALWKEFDPEQKKKYVEEALEETTAWKVKMEAYKKTPEFAAFEEKRKQAAAEQDNKKIKRKKPPKDKNAPKKPQTAFFLYSGSVRESVKNELPEGDRKKVVLITKKIGAMWKTLGAEEKASWKSKADKLKKEYNEVLAEYKKTEEYAQHQEVLKNFKAQQKELQKQANKKKKKAVVRKPKQVVQKRQIESESSDEESASDEPVPSRHVVHDVEMDSHEDTEEESSEDEETS